MAKKNNPYFEDFITMAGFSCNAAEYLQTAFRNFQPNTLSEYRKAMHKIENAEDEVKHNMMGRLVKEFVPPIDREDIIQLANKLDDVTDKIEDILIRTYMYNIQSIHPAALELSDVIVRCCHTLKVAMDEFPNFQKSGKLRQAIIDVNSMEGESDLVYIRAVRDLHEREKDPVQISVWSELFDRMEDCCDACEHVADSMEIIIMKNS